MKRPMSAGFHFSGFLPSSSSTLSNGIAICEMSYRRFCTSSCSGSIGKKGRNVVATSTENTLPKFELAVMRMYLSMLLKVLRPSITPSSSTIRLFSSRMMSAASLAMSTALSTLMPMSAARSAGASLMPSPMKPTTWPLARKARTMRSLCSGVSLANTWCASTTCDSALSPMRSTCAPSSTTSARSPTWAQTRCVTRSLSPVSTFTAMPLSASAFRAGAADSFGGSRMATYLISVSPPSSATEYAVWLAGISFIATATTRSPSSLSSRVTCCTRTSMSASRGSSWGPSPFSMRTRLHTASISSTAPLQISSWWSSRSDTTTDMWRRSKSKGTSSILR